MKRNFKPVFTVILFAVLACTLAACNFDKHESIKAITKPYIARYECTEARLGTTDLLEKYEYIYITLLDKSRLEVKFKPLNGEAKAFEGNYAVDPETREFTGEIGILGCSFKESVKIEKGAFTITKNILSMPLIMKFETN